MTAPSLTHMEMADADSVRFEAKVLRTDGCWWWIGCTNSEGYGRFRLGGRDRQAHRVAYEAYVGPIPEGLVLDHLVCDNPSCVRPDHLKPATNRENILRGVGATATHARKTHCAYGHELAGDNLVAYSRGGRVCRECNRRRGREGYERNADKVNRRNNERRDRNRDELNRRRRELYAICAMKNGEGR